MTPEIRLWRAVLNRAYEDAEQRSVERTRARKYLCGYASEEDLRLVCDFADVSADALIHWARKRYGNWLKEEAMGIRRHLFN